FHDHSMIGVSLVFTLPLISLEISAASLALFMCKAARLSSLTITKLLYLGLPQLCAFHPEGRPVVPTGILVQSSMSTCPAALLTATSENSSSATKPASMESLL